MAAWSFPWLFIGLVTVVDLVGLFYLWRRRQAAGGLHHSPARRPMAYRFPAERRRAERRAAARAAPLAQA